MCRPFVWGDTALGGVASRCRTASVGPRRPKLSIGPETVAVVVLIKLAGGIQVSAGGMHVSALAASTDTSADRTRGVLERFGFTLSNCKIGKR